jgi:peptidoglycan/LPS O-acetylase OafA/YrhL
MAQNKPKVHFDSVDLLRGLAALVVGFYHFSDYFLQKTNPLSIAFAKGYLGVEAFFVISGFVIPYSFAAKGYTIRQFWSVFIKRIVRIEPAYWASIGLMMLKDTFVNVVFYTQLPVFSIYNLFLHVFHANAIMHEAWMRGIYWTLAIDWQFYLLVCGTFFLINRTEWWARWLVYAFFAYAHWYAPYEWLPYHIAPFGAGVILFHYYRGYMTQQELAIALPALILVHYDGFDYTHGLATALSCAVILCFKKVGSWGKFLGKISYSFYLTHIFSGWAIVSGAAMMTKNETYLTIAVVIGIAFSVLFAHWFYNRVEKPTLDWVKRVGNS